LDSYESSVFWYYVLFRQLRFDKKHKLLGSRPWTVYELLREEETAKQLEITDLGLVFDPDFMWLALCWKEARKGILEGLEECPSWSAILAKQGRRQERMGQDRNVSEDYWKKCARSFSYTVPPWQLEKLSYLGRKLWHRKNEKYDDLIVLDMTGIDIPQLDGEATKNLELPVAKRVRFAHFYTEDPREYRAVQRMIAEENKRIDARFRVKKARRRIGQRDRRKMRAELGDKRAWYDASRIIGRLPRLLGKGMKSGRYQKFLSGKKSDELYARMVDEFINGNLIDTDFKNLEVALAALESLLEKENVPEEFSQWLKWKNKMEGVRKDVEA
jgi:hypothetical protein